MNALTQIEQHHPIGPCATPRCSGVCLPTLPDRRSARSESSPAGHVPFDA